MSGGSHSITSASSSLAIRAATSHNYDTKLKPNTHSTWLLLLLLLLHTGFMMVGIIAQNKILHCFTV